MATAAGNVRKMKSVLDQTVHYSLPVGDTRVELNALIGQSIKLTYAGVINCVACGRKSNKSFNQGYCFPCFRGLAQCDSCIMSPEKCHFHVGTCREPDWGEQNCMIDHFVYLANTSALKVGITRHSQIPTRWVDQGAVQALPIARVSSRRLSGLLEVAIGQSVADKTAWQTMLKGQPEAIDLYAARDSLLAQYEETIAALQTEFGVQALQTLPEAEVVEITYPVSTYPDKVKALNFDKQAVVEGRLVGIKGQYLILDCGVLNVRKFGGYHLQLEY
ncbi:MAG: hypothetical protein RI942_1895 [Pseudomonadota bacterium]|jgi:hypothetical protein